MGLWLVLSQVMKYNLCHIDTLLTGIGRSGAKENERCHRDVGRIPSRSGSLGPCFLLAGIRDQIRWESAIQFCFDRHLFFAVTPYFGNNLRKGQIGR